jgi:hypothetical protein
MKASPKSAPTAKEIKTKMYFRRRSSLIESAKAPIKETKLTITTLMKE